MNKPLILASLTAAVLLLGAKLSAAAEGAPPIPPEAAQHAAEVSKRTADQKAEIAARRKAAAKIKPVDINNASAGQLQKLPWITAADADKIIAGRPYQSKAWLVTKGVIGEGPYVAIKHLIIAGPIKKNAGQSAAPAAGKK